jgi:hypothetical protein
LRVGHRGDRLVGQLGDLAVRAGITLAHEGLGRDGEPARHREAPRRAGNVFVSVEDLADHPQHGRAAAAGAAR